MLLALATAAVGESPIGQVLIALAVVLASGKLGGDLAIRLNQPAVLGELVAGILVGNLGLLGFHALEGLKTDPYLGIFAEIGVVLLLFEVGLASTVHEMAKVGVSASIVAVLGVIAPMLLGWGVGAVLLPHASVYTHVFLGAALTATSVGITARVFRDLRASDSAEARIVLGAAVIDDVLGLVVLAAVGGIIATADKGQSVSLGAIGFIVFKAAGFLVGAILVGGLLSPRLFRATLRLKGTGLLLSTALVLCFLFGFAALSVGLAPIVGAFAAGLVLEPVHYQNVSPEPREHTVEELLAPVTSFLVPIFFVLMGLRVDMSIFAHGNILILSGALTFVAILGKQVCGLGVGKGINRMTIGLGMIPRGEVGLIFANMGLTITVKGEPVFSQECFSAIVIMVILTTLVTPPALRWSLARSRKTTRRAMAA